MALDIEGGKVGGAAETLAKGDKAALWRNLERAIIAFVSAVTAALSTYFGMGGTLVLAAALTLGGCAMIDKAAAGVADFADTNHDGIVSSEEAAIAGDKVAAHVPPVPGFPWLETVIGAGATLLVTGAGAYTAHKRSQNKLADAVVKTVEAADQGDGVKAAFADNRIPAIENALTRAKRL